jgi:hypothetical protein
VSIIPTTVTRTWGRSILQAKKNSPHIFFGTGLISVVAGTALACRATLKLEPLLEEVTEDVNHVKALGEGLQSDVDSAYSRSDYYKDLGYVSGKAVVRLGRLYGPAIAVSGFGIACLTGSHVQMTRRNAALTATLASVSKAYDNYRARIIEEMGAEKEAKIYGEAPDDVTEDGLEPKLNRNPNKYSPYAVIFDEANVNWTKDPELNRLFVQSQMNYANHKLHARGHLFLNEVYDALGVERTKQGAVVGWVVGGEGDDYVDFGVFNAPDFVNGWERSVILDFNVDGVIYNLI